MRILVTGANGFIGNHLCIKLFEEGHQIVGLDQTENTSDFLIHYKDNQSVEVQTKMEENWSMLRRDLTDESTVYDLKKLGQFDLIYHLASPIGVDKITNNSKETFRSTKLINDAMDQYCKDTKTPIVFSSSSEVFGESENITNDSYYKIKQLSDSPRWSYAMSKAYTEMLFHLSDYKSSIVRFFNVVGPGQETPGMVIPSFFKAALKNNSLIIKENGIRSYCHVKEAIEKLIHVGNGLYDNEYNKQSFNIGNTKNVISAFILAKKIIDITESESVIEQLDSKQQLKTRILTEDNFEIENIPIDNILKDCYEYYKSTDSQTA